MTESTSKPICQTRTYTRFLSFASFLPQVGGVARRRGVRVCHFRNRRRWHGHTLSLTLKGPKDALEQAFGDIQTLL